MGKVTLVSSAPSANATGNSTQTHLIYATNSARWWLFYLSSTQTLSTAWSTDFFTWTNGATLTLANAHASEGRNLSVAYANISSTDVVHIVTSYANSNTSHQTWHVRATISGSTLTFSSETQVGGTGTASFAQASDGAVTAISSNGHIAAMSSFILDSGGWDNMDIQLFPNTDSGSSWTQGTASNTDITNFGNGCASHFLGFTGAATLLAVCAQNSGSSTNLSWSQFTSTWPTGSWPAAANVFGSAQSSFANNDWGAVARTTSDIHLVLRTGTNTYSHQRFNGTAWAAGSSIPTQTSLAGGGMAMATDGTNVFLTILDSASGNAVRTIKWNGTAWATSWTTIETGSATRNNISACPQIENNSLTVIWTEGSSPFNIVGEQISLVPRSTFTQGENLYAGLASGGISAW